MNQHLIKLFLLSTMAQVAVITGIGELSLTKLTDQAYRAIRGVTEAGTRFFKIIYGEAAKAAPAFYKVGELAPGEVIVVKTKPYTLKKVDGTDYLNPRTGQAVTRDTRAIYVAKGEDLVAAYLRNIHDSLRITEMCNAVRHSGIPDNSNTEGQDAGEPDTATEDFNKLVAQAISLGIAEVDARSVSYEDLQGWVAEEQEEADKAAKAPKKRIATKA